MLTYPQMLPVVPPGLQVPDGMLLYDSEQDGWFPYIFQVGLHPLAHNHELFSLGHILVYIQDTLVDSLKQLEEFEASLEVPFGPDESVSNLWYLTFLQVFTFLFKGIFKIDHGDLIFIRDMYDPDPEHNIMGRWINDW
jgi:hypothetical protein